jgi:polysaccharide export outer membrane protein
MPEQIRAKVLVVLWAVGVCCLGSVGCQAQFSFLGGPLAPVNPEGPARQGTQLAEHRAEDSRAREIVRTSYQADERMNDRSPAAGLGPVLPSLPRVSVMPDLHQGPGSLGTLPDLQPAPVSGTYVSPRDRWTGEEGPDLPGGVQTTALESKPTEARPAEGKPMALTPAEGKTGPLAPTEIPLPLGPTATTDSHPGAAGCACGSGQGSGERDPNERPLPTELAMVSHPPYMIEPPDILLIDAVRIVPRPPYVVQPLDVLLIRVSNTLTNQPIDSVFTVGPDGTINLGFTYGSIRVAGMTLEMVQQTLLRHLSKVLREPQVAVALAQFRGVQQLRGEHLVRQDGTISLGTYGCVYVTGLTICQAKAAIERHLSQFVQDPEISLDVFAYNSKVYYIITDGAGFGQQVYRLPITGKETVLDAISAIQGLPAVASTRHIWVARPAPANHSCTQILPVDWRAIVEGGSTATNYQLFPGDRIYIRPDCLIWLDNALAKIISPIERLFGIVLLGNETVRSFGRNGTTGTGGTFLP